MRKQTLGLHKLALAALFTVGNALIRYPWRQGDRYTLMLFFVSVVGSLIPAFLLYPLFRSVWRKPLSQNRGRRWGVGALSVTLGAYALYCAVRCCADYVGFSMKLIIPQGSRFFLIAIFLSCAVWIASLSERGLDSFSLLAFVGLTLCVILLFSAGFQHFRWEYARADLFAWDTAILKSVPTLWKESLLPLTVLSLYLALTVPKGGEPALALGTGIGCVLLFLCVMQGILTFGTAYAAELEHPYSYAVRILSVGQYFFRLEGFSYLVDYLSCLIRCAVCLAVVKRLAARFAPRLSRRVPILCGVLIFAIFLIQ